MYFRTQPILPLSLLFLLLASGFVTALLGGSTFNLQLRHLWEALSGNQTLATELILSLRLPRVLIASAVGAALAISGALMQGITRNPLASPTLFGINAGAACLLVVGQTISIPLLSDMPLLIQTMLGALLAGAAVFLLSGGTTGRLHPSRMILAGVAVNALFLALTRTLLILDEQAQSVVSWLAGSLVDTDWTHWQQLWPAVLLGISVSLLLSQKLNLLALGDEAAAGLGGSPERLRLQVSAVVVLLAGSAVAVSGPIAFLGLLVPHLARLLVGQDYRMLLPTTGMLGAALLCWADYLSRLLIFPTETPVGLVLALLGAPFFIWLSRRQGRTA
ncbi:iron chelate uptake ABC transporter family permease subunit [Pontibacterium granulatum]|uniref:FecCD family ABC transporter permease n=1 Tax=Pontibacterium granulatum TaxID=2036029 RepID=UPI00249C9003|nr:iron chelate uptake ABC transporter family permease subunit [Pontibacterium granulatum]MDI3324539.1 iron chelate uptake ABC transporter family permease subunit [Pontibacterium granulatum]